MNKVNYKILYKSVILLLFLGTLIPRYTFAENTVEATESINTPLIDISIGVELSRFEDSASKIAESIGNASNAIQKMAKNPSLNADQQANIMQSFKSIERLAETFNQSIKELPNSVSSATPPIEKAIDDLFSNVLLAIILLFVALMIVLIVVVLAVYYWLLKPTSSMLINTTSKLDNMARALQITANIVEKSSDQQIKILQANKELLGTFKE